MLDDVLVAAAVLFAAGNVLVGGLAAWGVSGGDGPSSPTRGLLGLSVLGTLLASLVSTMWLLPPLSRAAVVVAVVAVIAGSSYLLAATQEARHRRWLAVAVVAVGALISLLIGVTGAAGPVGGRHVLLASLGPAALAVAVAALVAMGAEDVTGQRTALAVVLAVLCIPSVLLAIAWSAG